MKPRAELRRRLGARFPGSRLELLVGDASTRSFLRLHLATGETRVVMDYGRAFDGETDDVRLARVFRDAALPVAGIREVLPEVGCLLLEDLGDLTLQRAVRARDGLAEALYERAVDLAVRVARDGSPVLAASARPPDLALDADRFRFEMDFFLHHFVVGRLGATPSAGLTGMLHALAAEAARTPRRVLCHRDFHSRNLMVRADGSLAMVDLQDARWGPDCYDLASLLRDAYVEIPEQRVERMIGRFLGAWPDLPDAQRFRERFDVAAAQRMIKALGTFGFQLHERGNDRYLEAERRMRARLERVLLAAGPVHADLHRALASVGAFLGPEDQ